MQTPRPLQQDTTPASCIWASRHSPSLGCGPSRTGPLVGVQIAVASPSTPASAPQRSARGALMVITLERDRRQWPGRTRRVPASCSMRERRFRTGGHAASGRLEIASGVALSDEEEAVGADGQLVEPLGLRVGTGWYACAIP